MRRKDGLRPVRSRAGKTLGAVLPALVPIAAGILLASAGLPLVAQLRNLVFDNYQWMSPRPWRPDIHVRVVDIDDASLAKIGQWPWPRDRLAELARKLARNGTIAAGFDITFSEADRAGAAPAGSQGAAQSTDAIFAAALGAGPNVLAFYLNHETGATELEPKMGFASAGDDARLFVPTFSRAVLPIPALADAAPGLGVINFMPDRDLVVRNVPLVFGLGANRAASALVPSFDAELLRIAQGASTIVVKASNASGESGLGAKTGIVAVKIGALEIPTDPDGTVRVRYAGFQKRRRIPAWQVLEDQVPVGELAGALVIVSSSAAALSDLRSTPIEGAVPGGEVHAELLEHVLSGQQLSRPDYAPGLESFAIVLGGALIGLLARTTSPLMAALGTMTMVAGAGFGSFYAFRSLALLFDPLLPGGTWILVYVLTTLAAYRGSERERRFVRSAFSRYVSPAVVEQLARDPARLKLGGEARTVTILFADARDFTSRSEGRSAEGVVGFLNRLMTPLTTQVLAADGTVDKYLGDGLMAFWNAPLDVAEHANCACRAALAMQDCVAEIDRLEKIATDSEGSRFVPVRIGIGLNTGEAFVGNMGSEQRFDYSIVGDPVNTAARLETATKDLGVPIVVSETTAAAATAYRFVDLGNVALKGKAQPARIFALHGAAAALEPGFEEFLALHRAALAAALHTGEDPHDAIDRARAHPVGAAYAAFYDQLAKRPVDAPPVLKVVTDAKLGR